MCGICGYYSFNEEEIIDSQTLSKMLSFLQHRGPDEAGLYLERHMGLGHRRLSIIDLKKGKQPISNEDDSMLIVCNGAIYNYIELKEELEGRGHRFKTSSDTEAILHLYEEEGKACALRLNGQFAFAIWNKKTKELFICRDRFGVKPLFYTRYKDVFIFASEVKAIFAYPDIPRAIDVEALDQVFTFWATMPSRTIFKDIFELEPGHHLYVKPGTARKERYWRLAFPLDGGYERRSETYYIERLRDLLEDSVKIRLRADVAVGSYLSGGIDSSTVTSIMRRMSNGKLETFSVRFVDKNYDETSYQNILIAHLGVHSNYITCGIEDIISAFPEVMWHIEVPILRTAPAPLYLLSQLARAKGYKVILTGDGADEFLLGYDIFKEVKIRRFWAKEPASERRPLLLKELYPYLPFAGRVGLAYLKSIFGKGREDYDDPYYSHVIRWDMTSRIKDYFSDELKAALKDYDSREELKAALDPKFERWDYMAKAQYLEVVLFFSNFLLSAQGDRVSMANGVEMRFPFLDHRIVEFVNQIPPDVKMKVLNEKYLLKRCMEKALPKEVIERNKQPYRAPGINFSRKKEGRNYIDELLSTESIKDAGYFNPDYVKALVNKFSKDEVVQGEVDNMALCGILSLQLIDGMFVKRLGRIS